MSPEVQSRGISGPTKRTHVPQNFFKTKCTILNRELVITLQNASILLIFYFYPTNVFVLCISGYTINCLLIQFHPTSFFIKVTYHIRWIRIKGIWAKLEFDSRIFWSVSNYHNHYTTESTALVESFKLYLLLTNFAYYNEMKWLFIGWWY